MSVSFVQASSKREQLEPHCGGSHRHGGAGGRQRQRQQWHFWTGAQHAGGGSRGVQAAQAAHSAQAVVPAQVVARRAVPVSGEAADVRGGRWCCDEAMRVGRAI